MPEGPAITVTFYDSELDDSSESELDIPELDIKRENLEDIDEETENQCDLISDLLSDIGKIEPIGKKYLRLEFFNPKNITFIDKDEDCDFDLNEDGYPFLPDRGEEYIKPFFKKLVSMNPKLKNITIETNSKNMIFKI